MSGRKMRLIPFTFFFGLLVFAQCKSNNARLGKTYDSLVSARMGNEFQETLNKSKTYSLVHAPDTGKYSEDYRYMVVKLNDNSVVLHGMFNRGGYVRWAGDSAIELLSVPKDVRAVPDSSLYKETILLKEPQ